MKIEQLNPQSDFPRSQATAAYTRLRNDILAGRLAPGERLKINDLAALIEVSPGAVREALSRLLPEQLVTSRDQKGFAVAPLSIADLEDLTDIRCEVETSALRRSVQRGEVGWESAVLAAAHRLRRTDILLPDQLLNPIWVERHQAFHIALVSACGNRRLLDFHALLYQQSERYRGLSVRSDGDRDIVGEHQGLVDAALDRDPERLVTLAVHHLRETTRRIVKAVSNEWAEQDDAKAPPPAPDPESQTPMAGRRSVKQTASGLKRVV